MHKIRLRINNTVADSLLIIISKKCTGEPLLKLQEAIEALLDVSLPEQSSVIPHLVSYIIIHFWCCVSHSNNKLLLFSMI